MEIWLASVQAPVVVEVGAVGGVNYPGRRAKVIGANHANHANHANRVEGPGPGWMKDPATPSMTVLPDS